MSTTRVPSGQGDFELEVLIGACAPRVRASARLKGIPLSRADRNTETTPVRYRFGGPGSAMRVPWEASTPPMEATHGRLADRASVTERSLADRAYFSIREITL